MNHFEDCHAVLMLLTRLHIYRLSAAAILLLAGNASSASTATENELGFRYEVLASGSDVELEINVRPKRDFTAVEVEAGSGIVSMTPPCILSNLIAGGSYTCRIGLTGKRSSAAMTLNIIARYAHVGGGLPQTEIHHLSVKNASFLPSAKARAASKHVLKNSAASSR